MIKATDIETLDSFKRNTKAHLAKLRRTGSPCVLTVNGKGAVVVQDAAAYEEEMAGMAMQDRIDTIAAIRQGIAESQHGLGRPAAEVFRELRAGIKKLAPRRKRAAS